ncbi:MAG: alpha/beta hydrolase [Pseudomonadota bacterium]
MAIRWGLIGLIVLMITACGETDGAPTPPTSNDTMTWPDLTARPLPQPSTSIRYREGDAGVIDLWIPQGEGPHPVVAMIHGGCWQKSIADRTLMNYAAEDLRQRGLAVWNIEYRGVDEPSGGYPGTFLDVAAALDMLAGAAETHNLDNGHVVAFGHSAGGHLAVWAASRRKIPQHSPLYRDNPLPLGAVVNSGGLADLAASEPVTLKTCLADIKDLLIGNASEHRPNPLADTSPTELFAPNAAIISVNGSLDRIAPPALGRQLTAAVLDAGGEASYHEVAGAGHVELIAPGTDAFELEANLILRELAR